MKKFILAALFLLTLNSIGHAQSSPCAAKAVQVEPQLSAEARKTYDLKLAEAFIEHEKSAASADSIIWLGRRIAYLGNYKQAIRVFTTGVAKYPNDVRFLRHRGHRYITLRCFDDAAKDLEKAAAMIKGKRDEVEPDGLPNARNIPTSTLQSNIWYHLGLAYYLKGDFESALKAYAEAQKVSTNNDMRVATANWHYITLGRLGQVKEAKKILEPFAGNIEVIENDDYLTLIKFYRGEMRLEIFLSKLAGKPDSVSRATLLYGLGNWYLDHKMRVEAQGIFRSVITGKQWPSFGYIAAEVEVDRMNKTVKSFSDIIVRLDLQHKCYLSRFRPSQ